MREYNKLKMIIKEIKKSRSLDNNRNRKHFNSFFSIQGKTIIGRKTKEIQKQLTSLILQTSPQKKKFQYDDYDPKEMTSTEVVIPPKSPPSILLKKGKKNKKHFIQFNQTVKNDITIINNIKTPPSPFKDIKGILNSNKEMKKRKSVKFLTTRPSLLDEEEKINNKPVRKLFYPQTVKLNKSNEVTQIAKSISQKKKESKENVKQEIDQFPKCHCVKDLGSIKGFSALTHSNQKYY